MKFYCWKWQYYVVVGKPSMLANNIFFKGFTTKYSKFCFQLQLKFAFTSIFIFPPRLFKAISVWSMNIRMLSVRVTHGSLAKVKRYLYSNRSSKFLKVSLKACFHKAHSCHLHSHWQWYTMYKADRISFCRGFLLPCGSNLES